jgi:hypothetical protein
VQTFVAPAAWQRAEGRGDQLLLSVPRHIEVPELTPRVWRMVIEHGERHYLVL